MLEREGFPFGDGRALGGTRLSSLVWKSEPSLETARTLSSRFLRAERIPLWASLQSREEMAAGEERSVGGRWQGSRQGGEDLQTRELFGRSLLEVRATLAFCCTLHRGVWGEWFEKVSELECVSSAA